MTLPGFHECPECENGSQHCGTGLYEHEHRCPECGGAGQVPDDDTVGRVAQAHLRAQGHAAYSNEYERTYARAALLAYARHTQETKP